MLYDEFMGMVQYSAQVLHESPLAPMRQWPMETYGPVSKERERMKLFAELRVAEHVPGLDWKAFNDLTPEQTEWVLDIAQSIAKEKLKAMNAANANLNNLTRPTQL